MRIRLSIDLHIGDDEPDEDRYNDAIGHYQTTGFTTERDGRIGDIQ